MLAAVACSEEGNQPKNEGKWISNRRFSLQPSCLSTAKGQPLQQATIKSRSFCLFNSLSEWFWEQSMMQGKDVTAAVLAATHTLFNLILFLLVLLYLFIGPGSTRLELNEKPKGISVSVNTIFLSLEAKYKANSSPEFLKLPSTYETTFITFITTFFSPNTLALQVLQPLLFSPKLSETQETLDSSFLTCKTK